MPSVQNTQQRDLKASLTKVVSRHGDMHAGLAHHAMDAAERKRQRQDALAANLALMAQQGK